MIEKNNIQLRWHYLARYMLISLSKVIVLPPFIPRFCRGNFSAFPALYILLLSLFGRLMGFALDRCIGFQTHHPQNSFFSTAVFRVMSGGAKRADMRAKRRLSLAAFCRFDIRKQFRAYALEWDFMSDIGFDFRK